MALCGLRQQPMFEQYFMRCEGLHEPRGNQYLRCTVTFSRPASDPDQDLHEPESAAYCIEIKEDSNSLLHLKVTSRDDR